MSCAPERMILNDKVGCSEDVNTSSLTEEIFIPHQELQTDKVPLSSLLPPPPHLYSRFPSPASLLPDQAYLQAAAIFQRLRTEKPVTHQHLHYGKNPGTPLQEGRDKTAEQQAYQLAFSTLKYQDLLEDIMMDSCFHTSQHLSSDLLPLAMVMLFDFQDRRFLLRKRSTEEEEEAHREVRDLESHLHRCKTKLAAALARCRVKLSLQSVSCILSDPVRTKQQRTKLLPLYAWVNALQTSVEEVCEQLKHNGLCEVENMSDIRGPAFRRDPLCPDTLILSQHVHAVLQHSSLTTAHALHIQDRSVCVAVSVLRPLLFDNGDVLVAGSFSAVTVAHIAVVAAARSGRVLVCGGDHTPAQVEEIQELLQQMDITNVRVLSEAFSGLNEWDATVQRLKVIMVLPQCSSSALNDPVPIIHSEHGDWDLLTDLSHGSVSQKKIHKLTTQQSRLLAHALAFSKVQTVVYCTRSVYPEENEELVRRVLVRTHTHTKLLPFRVNGPIFPHDAQSGDTADSKFFRLESSQFTNGCFVARLSRQADPTKVETVQDVLARAAAKGLLGLILPEQSNTGKKGKSKKNRGASAADKLSSPSKQERLGKTGRESGSGQDPVGHSGNEDENGEGDVEGDGEREENKGANGRRKIRGNKGRKRKIKQRPNQTNKGQTVSKSHEKSQKKKPTKKKQSHQERHPIKSKPRRIPRLTLSLISSAKPSNPASPLKAQTDSTRKHPAAARPTLVHTSAQQAQKQNTESKSAVKEAAKPGSLLKRKEEVLKPADFVLPPISSSTSSSLSSRSGTSLHRPPSSALQPRHAHTPASSSSSVSLPSL